jgi:hypothetical protein
MRPARRAVRALSLVLLALVALSCDGDRPAPPTAPVAVTGQPTVSLGEAGDPILAAKIFAEIEQLFTDLPRIEQARKHFAGAVSQWNKEHPEQARDKVRILITETLQQMDQGLIRDPDGSGPLTVTSGALQFFNDLYAYVGLPTDDQEVDGDTYLAVVPPSNQTQTFASGLRQWTVIPPNTFNQTVLLYVNREREDPDLESGFPPASAPYEVHFVPDLAFPLVYVAICPDPHDLPLGAARLAHELDDGTVEILDPVPNDFICEFEGGDGEIGDATPSIRPRGFLAHARPLLKKALGVFAPTTLYAGHSAIMGGVTTLSPLQVVIVSGGGISSISPPVTYGDDAFVDATFVDAAGAPVAGALLELIMNDRIVGEGLTNAEGAVRFTVSGLDAGTHDYVVRHATETRAVSTSGQVEVARKALTLTVPGGEFYQGYVPACTVGYAGLVYEDSPASIGSVSTCSYDLPIGTHTVSPTAIDPSPANYDVIYQSGTVTILEGEIIG